MSEKDLRDIAAIHLTAESVASLKAAGRSPIQIADVLRGVPQPGWYLLYGYPQAWFSVGPGELSHPGISYLINFYTPSEELLASMESDPAYGMAFRPELHGLFNMSSQGLRVRDGVSVPLPDYDGMKGISGCGIWRLCDDSFEAMRTWNVGQCRLAAIEHRYDAGNKFVHATWNGVALGRIADEFPHLEPAIRTAPPRIIVPDS